MIRRTVGFWGDLCLAENSGEGLEAAEKAVLDPSKRIAQLFYRNSRHTSQHQKPILPPSARDMLSGLPFLTLALPSHSKMIFMKLFATLCGMLYLSTLYLIALNTDPTQISQWYP